MFLHMISYFKMYTVFHAPFSFFLILIIISTLPVESTAISAPKQLTKGFKATPDDTIKTFQPILVDSTGNFSLSFLRVNQVQLALVIVHVPSGETMWQANSSELAQWGKQTELFFNGSLVLTDHRSGVFWSTNTSGGDHVVLTQAPNLRVLNGLERNSRASVLWQSFDFPSDTLVENQNFTSAMSLVSSNGLYTMRLGFNFFGLYAKFNLLGLGSDQIYFKHRALEAKVAIVEGQGPILVRLSSDGFMGMYQNSTVPADVQSFNSYQRVVSGPRRIRLEADGNLKGYYWSGSSWLPDYVAIPEPCELPSRCGAYGLCKPGDGCSCLDNRTLARTPPQCHPSQQGFGGLCGSTKPKYWVLRRTGVELPYKELMGFTKMPSYDQCEKSCEMNCTCWGALYNNASGFCYTVEYPIQTILEVGDDTKMGYFKVWEGARKKSDRWLGIGIGLLCGAIFILVCALYLGCYKVCKRNESLKNRFLEEENIVSHGPYKDLGSHSFGSIELSNK